jgi:hypothetical protein
MPVCTTEISWLAMAIVMWSGLSWGEGKIVACFVTPRLLRCCIRKITLTNYETICFKFRFEQLISAFSKSSS